MTEINENVVREAERRSQNLLAEDLVALIERHHPHETLGVERSTVTGYAAALADGAESDFEGDTFEEAVAERLTDADTWQGDDVLYALDDDRVSAYPANWHDALGGSTDVREYVRYLREDAEEFEDLESGGKGRGIPESTLLDIVAVVGHTDRETVKAKLEDRRKNGELTEDADQHPDARVRLD